MHRNKPKYISVRQDSFVFEGAKSRMVPAATASALRRLNTTDAASTETPRTPGTPSATAAVASTSPLIDDMSAQIKINEVTLFAQNNEEEWAKSRHIYKCVELVTYMWGLLITLVSFLYSICLMFYSRQLKEVPRLFKTIDTNMLIAHSALFYFIIEMLSLVIYLTDLLRITRIWSCFKLEDRIKSKELVLKTNDYETSEQQDTKIAETIENLKIRCAIRDKFIDILQPLIKLNTLITLYFLFFVFLPKYVLAILMQLNATLNAQSTEFALVDYVTSNSSDLSAHLALHQQFNCCLLRTNKNETILLNTNKSESSSTTCDINAFDSDCLTNLNSRLDFYVKLLAVIFYATATINLFLKLISLYNFKYWLIHRLLFKPKTNEDELCRQYDDSRSRLFRRHLESRIAENEKYWAENFLNLNLYSGGGGAATAVSPHEQDNSANVKSDPTKYLNLEMENFLNDDERQAIEMIDDALKKPPNSPASPPSAEPTSNTNTFKAKKPSKH